MQILLRLIPKCGRFEPAAERTNTQLGYRDRERWPHRCIGHHLSGPTNSDAVVESGKPGAGGPRSGGGPLPMCSSSTGDPVWLRYKDSRLLKLVSFETPRRTDRSL